MASGLVALLDDVAGLTKLAAASLDDVGAAAGRAGTKAIGVVVDDAAVTPAYVTGFTAARELPIIGRIALGSLRNKLLLLLPAAMLLSAFAPWAITPLLMAGGTFLCFEGAEKVLEAVSGEQAKEEVAPTGDLARFEREKVSSAVRTDLILSAEIVAIALADLADRPLLTQAVALAAVGVGITVLVYGVVALIVKMDDIGLYLAERGGLAQRAIGRGLVRGMPVVMRVLSIVGTAAMLWVGGGIVLHGAEQLGLAGPQHMIHHAGEVVGHALPIGGAAAAWLVGALASGLFGLVLGGALAAAMHRLRPH